MIGSSFDRIHTSYHCVMQERKKITIIHSAFSLPHIFSSFSLREVICSQKIVLVALYYVNKSEISACLKVDLIVLVMFFIPPLSFAPNPIFST